jgi:hypothetical protein
MLASFLFPPHTQPPETGLDHVADLLLIIGCAMIVLFTILYGVGFRWWLTRAGRGVFAVFCSMSLLMGLITASHFSGGDYLFRDLLRVIVYVLLPLSMTYMFYGLARNFFEGPTDVTIQRSSIGRRGLPAAHVEGVGIGEPDVSEPLP